MNTALIAIARMENRYLRHWVEHYQCLGLSNIILCDNNDIDGERFDEVIQDYIESGFVIVKDYRGMDSPQILAYQDMFEEYHNAYDWLAFFDCDEYLIMEEGFRNIEEFLSQDKFNDFHSVRINWKCYGDSGLIEPDYSTPVTERFTIPSNCWKEDCTIKSIVRGKIAGITIPNPHYAISEQEGYHSCDVNGTLVPTDEMYLKEVIEGTRIHHYVTKTIKEYFQKIKRGDVLIPLRKRCPIGWIQKFFLYNEKTEEKERLMNEFIEETRPLRCLS